MLLNATVTWPDSSRLFLIEQIFPNNLCKDIGVLFDSENDWEKISDFDHYSGRMVYAGQNDTVNRINDFAASVEFLAELESLLGKRLEFAGSSLWLDSAGYKITPHYDLPGFDYAVQVYMPQANDTNNMLGTCFYKDNDPLFEMHYRQNTGYFIDKTHTILHGLNGSIPADYKRRSVYLRYKEKQ